MTRSPWARQYAQTPTSYIWGTEPSALAREVSARLRPGARVLDLGSGEGRDSVFFASRGFAVTGVEVSRAGLRKAERLARAQGVTVDWVCSDMARARLAGPFDLVYSCGAIHYVPRAERRPLIARLQAITRPGGLHALVVFTDRAIHVELGEVIDYFGAGELRAAYAGWRVLQHQQGIIACARDGRRHRHSYEQLVARAARHRGAHVAQR